MHNGIVEKMEWICFRVTRHGIRRKALTRLRRPTKARQLKLSVTSHLPQLPTSPHAGNCLSRPSSHLTLLPTLLHRIELSIKSPDLTLALRDCTSPRAALPHLLPSLWPQIATRTPPTHCVAPRLSPSIPHLFFHPHSLNCFCDRDKSPPPRLSSLDL